MTRVLITGASGFIGSALLSRLAADRGFVVRAASRRHEWRPPGGVLTVHVNGQATDTDWKSAIDGINVVIHTAARVHVTKDRALDPLSEFRHVNVDGSMNLARQAAAAGVRRFLFVSSIKVNGEATLPGSPFTADDAPAPVDPYGISKHEAESGLYRLGVETGMEIVVIRPPLVYGPGVKGNFLALMHWLSRGIPLPLASIRNRRSLVALKTLTDLIVTCIRHPAAANQTFLVSDGEDLSTPDLILRLAQAMGRPARLFPFPSALLHAGASLFGRRDAAQRLCGSLQVDISKTRNVLGWTPSIDIDGGLAEVARWYLENDRMKVS